MVLRDERDKLTSKRILCRGKTRADAKWARRKSKIHRRKSRIKTKKNIDIPVVFTRKKEEQFCACRLIYSSILLLVF